ncbi:MAG TPA: hypothetical protein VKD47_04755 [Miltoncostaeaceae bacterium]|nr:hypothetical protein [Miltoncostaeaceae bacterium]
MSLVGGAVRDALLGVAGSDGDLDLVVEGDAPALAERLGHALSARVQTHGRFGTAVLELPHDRWLDLVTARRERYPEPGALPVVEPGSLVDDLARRDFTVNAMAYRLTGPAAGALVDPHRGREDLEAGIIRALRPGSFAEDPSRLLRAARYAARLDFVLAPDTAADARDAAGSVDIASARVGEELRRLLAERTAPRAIALAQALGVPWLALAPPPGELAERFAAIDAALAHPLAPPIPAWAMRLGLVARAEDVERAAIDGWARGVAIEAQEGPALAARLAERELRPSEIDRILGRHRRATCVSALAAGAAPVARWWEATAALAPRVSGADLVAAGVRPGPVIGRALAAVRAAVLDGEAPTREEQLAIALGAVESR